VLALWALSHVVRLRTRGPGALRPTLACLTFGLGLCVPPAATWAGFAAVGAGADFVANNFLLNARWRPLPTREGLKLLQTSGPMLALALVGTSPLLASFVASFRAKASGTSSRDYGGLLLLGTALGLFSGVAVLPVAQAQYYLIPIPITCLFAIRGLSVLAARFRPATRLRVVVGAVVILLLPALWGLRATYGDGNARQLAHLREVFDHTAPSDVVMDGWEGMGVFRPHAFYYWFLHEEIVGMLPPARLATFLDDLETGRIQPRLIVLDKNLRSLGPRFLRVVDQHYTTTDNLLYYRRSPP
jgi:hypothetical protein